MKTICIHSIRIIPDETRVIDKGAICIQDGKITSVLQDEKQIEEWKNQVDEVVDGKGYTCTPGLIDIHLHGAAGQDLISATQQAVDAVSRNIVQDGVTSFLASLTVVSHEACLTILRDLANTTPTQGGAQMLGIHSEGPYLSEQFKALMDNRFLRDPSISELHEMIEAANHKLRVMTIACERKGMKEWIKEAVDNQVVLMIGHSAATSQDVHAAKLGGVKGFTHLYNAMSQHLHRDPGVVTGAFLEKEMVCELIADGFHVDADVVNMTYQTMGASRLILITDAMLAKGMPDGIFSFSNLVCEKKGQHVQVVETGRRAGSAIGLHEAMRMMQQMTGCSDQELVQMACVNPANLLQETNKGKLEAGMDADLALFDCDWQCQATLVQGEWCYRNL